LPALKTDRLVLRLLENEDVAGALSYVINNKEHLAGSAPARHGEYYTKRYWFERVKQDREDFEHDCAVRLFVFEHGQPNKVIGQVNLNEIVRSAAHFCYLGYGLAADKQGQGLMSEAVGRCIQFAFEELNLHRVMANYVPTNKRSGKLLERLGFKVEGFAENYLYLDGSWQDHVLTSLTNLNWRPPTRF
jgi:ribosomal-protein-alanine N-acetyltransferase